MNQSVAAQNPAGEAGEPLFQFAIDRGDMQTILDSLPPEAQEKRVTLEYEIQILRIVSVGWAIAFFLTEESLKDSLGQRFWDQIRSFAATLSTATSLTVGSNIDYFDVLKQRLDYYVGAMDRAGQRHQPAMAIGPAFAEACGDKDDAFACLAGSKMFTHTIHAVREYLDETIRGQAGDGGNA
jgi:hypothetical protein